MILTLTSLLILVGCIKETPCTRGEGNIEEVNMSMEAFNSVILQGSMDVEIAYGVTQSVTAIGHRNIIDELETRVKDGVWTINLGQGCFTDFDLKIYITIPELAMVKNSGSGNITVKDVATPDTFTAEANGSGGTLISSLTGPSVIRIILGGVGPIEFENACPGVEQLFVTNTGASTFHGFPMQVPACSVTLSGNGHCEVYASKTLDVTILGSGNVYYKGHPEINIEDSGSGKLISKN